MKLLFILEDDYPYYGACTNLLNNIFFVGDLLAKVDSIDVLSIKSVYSSKEKELYNGITVHNAVLMSKVSVQQYRQLLFKHPILSLKGLIDKVFFMLSKESISRRNVLRIKNAIRRIETEEFDVIIAVMGSPEVADAALSYRYDNPNVKLILYQVDPFSTNEVYMQETKEQRICFERELYEVCDYIIVTPIIFKEAQEVYSKEITDKMISMESPNVVPKECVDHDSSQKVRCIFAGNIYGGIRDPKYTWRLFDNVDSRIKFEMIGSMNYALKEDVKSHNVILHGPKSLSETQNQLMNSDILVNIGNKMVNQVPSKLFDYISYGKPIINVCKNRECPTLQYLDNYPYVLNLFEEEEIFEHQVEALNKFIIENCNNRVSSEELIKIFKTSTPEYCAQQMMGIFNDLKNEQEDKK